MGIVSHVSLLPMTIGADTHYAKWQACLRINRHGVEPVWRGAKGAEPCLTLWRKAVIEVRAGDRRWSVLSERVRLWREVPWRSRAEPVLSKTRVRIGKNEDWYGKAPDSFFNNKVLSVLTVVLACIPAATWLYAIIAWLRGR